MQQFYVLEISSFQLDGMFTFRADIAILLNITPDHLDRYEYKFENYVEVFHSSFVGGTPFFAGNLEDETYKNILAKMKEFEVV